MRATRRALSLAPLILATALVNTLAVSTLAGAQESSKPPPPPPDSESEAQAAQALRTRWAVIDVSDAAFKKLDTDHDGRISALEANANPKVAARFLDADKNHDGYLSPEEFRTLGSLPPPAATRPIAPSPKPSPDLP
jgi:hypothetical protein